MKGLKKKQTVVWIGLLLVLVLSFGLALAGGEVTSRSLVSGGGGSVSQSGLTLQTAIGQPAVGAVQNGETLCSGFLCSADAPPLSEGQSKVYLPFIIR